MVTVFFFVLINIVISLYTEITFEAINTNKGIKIGGTKIINLCRADDAVLFNEKEQDLQEILNEVDRIGKT